MGKWLFCYWDQGTRNPEPKTNPPRNPEIKIFDSEPGLKPGFPGRVAKPGQNPARRPSLIETRRVDLRKFRFYEIPDEFVRKHYFCDDYS